MKVLLQDVAYGFRHFRKTPALAFPDQQNIPVSASPSPMIIGFAFALSLVTGILFGLAHNAGRGNLLNFLR